MIYIVDLISVTVEIYRGPNYSRHFLCVLLFKMLWIQKDFFGPKFIFCLKMSPISYCSDKNMLNYLFSPFWEKLCQKRWKHGFFLYTLWNKSFDSKEIQQNLIPSKIMPIGWVNLNSKKNLRFVIGLRI